MSTGGTDLANRLFPEGKSEGPRNMSGMGRGGVSGTTASSTMRSARHSSRQKTASGKKKKRVSKNFISFDDYWASNSRYRPTKGAQKYGVYTRQFILPPVSLFYQIFLMVVSGFLYMPFFNPNDIPHKIANNLFFLWHISGTAFLSLFSFFFILIATAAFTSYLPGEKLYTMVPTPVANVMLANKWIVLRLLWMPMFHFLLEPVDCVSEEGFINVDGIDCGSGIHAGLLVMCFPVLVMFIYAHHRNIMAQSHVLERIKRAVASPFTPIHGQEFAVAFHAVLIGKMTVLVLAPFISGPLMAILSLMMSVALLLTHLKYTSFSSPNSFALISACISVVVLSDFCSTIMGLELWTHGGDNVPWPFTEAAQKVQNDPSNIPAIIFGVLLIPTFSNAYRNSRKHFLRSLLPAQTDITLIKVGGTRAVGIKIRDYVLSGNSVSIYLQVFDNPSQYLRDITLHRCSIDNDACRVLLGALSYSPALSSLRKLDLSRNMITAPSSIIAAATGIDTKTPSGNSASDYHGLGQFILSCPTIFTLILAHNPLQDAGLVPIAQALMSRQCVDPATGDSTGRKFAAPSLVNLDITNCSLTADSAERISDVLRENDTIGSILVGNNSLGISGARALSRAFSIHNSLVNMSLEWAELQFTGIESCIYALAARGVSNKTHPGLQNILSQEVQVERRNASSVAGSVAGSVGGELGSIGGRMRKAAARLSSESGRKSHRNVRGGAPLSSAGYPPVVDIPTPQPPSVLPGAIMPGPMTSPVIPPAAGLSHRSGSSKVPPLGNLDQVTPSPPVRGSNIAANVNDAAKAQQVALTSPTQSGATGGLVSLPHGHHTVAPGEKPPPSCPFAAIAAAADSAGTAAANALVTGGGSSRPSEAASRGSRRPSGISETINAAGKMEVSKKSANEMDQLLFLGKDIPPSAPPGWKNGDSTITVLHRVMVGNGVVLNIHVVEPAWPQELGDDYNGEMVRGITLDLKCNSDVGLTRLDNLDVGRDSVAFLLSEREKTSRSLLASGGDNLFISSRSVSSTSRSTTRSTTRSTGSFSATQMLSFEGMWETVGGDEEGIDFYEAITHRFYETILADPAVGSYFTGFGMHRMFVYQTEYLAYLMSEGRSPYTGRNISTVHDGMDISGNAWETVLARLSDAFINTCEHDHNMSKSEATRFLELFLSKVEPLRSMIVAE